MDELIVRRVVEADRNEWLRLRMALWPHETQEHLLREMAGIWRLPRSMPVFVVQRANGRLGGFLEGNLRSTAQGCASSPVAYIEGWYVDADLRRQGVGGRLVKVAEEWARSIGCTEIASDCVVGNEDSLHAHLKLGYIEEGRLIHFRKELKTGAE